MESGIKSSFIPQDATIPQAVRPVRRTGLADLLILISIVFLVASLALAAGVFLYHQYLQQSSTAKVDQLKRAREAFEPTLIQELTRLDDRMKAADSILKGHIAPTIFFRILEQLTLQTVAFKNLSFKGGEEQSMAITMDGLARSVNSIALQADYMSKSGIITNPIFSNIDRRIDGVHFNLSAKINPVSLNYGQLLSGSSGGALPQVNTQNQSEESSLFDAPTPPAVAPPPQR